MTVVACLLSASCPQAAFAADVWFATLLLVGPSDLHLRMGVIPHVLYTMVFTLVAHLYPRATSARMGVVLAAVVEQGRSASYTA